MRVTFTILLLACMVSSAMGFMKPPVASPENRFAIVIDATSSEDNADYSASFQELLDSIEKTGIPHEHIHVLSGNQNSKAVSGSILESLDIPQLKSADSPETELQVYITAHGVSNGERDMIVPADVPVDSIDATTDPRLISFQDIEDRLSASGAKKILLVMNFKSVREVTRSAGSQNKANNIDITRYRGSSEYFFDEEERNVNKPQQSQENRETVNAFQYMRIVTRDQSVTESKVNTFYPLLKSAFEGYADISGNNDGYVQAEELAYYIRDNAGKNVEISKNGNAEYSICRAEKRFHVPTGLFQTIGETFTRDEFKKERTTAFERERKLKLQNEAKK